MPTGPSAAELKAIEDAKAAKIAKKAEREANEKAAREKKELAAIAEKERKERELIEAEAAGKSAITALSSGLKGSALVDEIKSLGAQAPTGAALLYQVLEQSNDDVLSSNWWTDAEYGEALKKLLAGSQKKEVAALYSVQIYCAEKKFPKVKVNGVTKKVIESLFGILLSNELIDGESFLAWTEDDEGEDSLGRLDAIVQTTALVNSIREALVMEDSEEEEEEEEEIDASREVF
jgi:hypothetical protein